VDLSPERTESIGDPPLGYCGPLLSLSFPPFRSP
jgi:hypothetical protein